MHLNVSILILVGFQPRLPTILSSFIGCALPRNRKKYIARNIKNIECQHITQDTHLADKMESYDP